MYERRLDLALPTVNQILSESYKQFDKYMKYQKLSSLCVNNDW